MTLAADWIRSRPEIRLCYLATPYSRFPGGIEAAFVAACRVVADLLKSGVSAYSPIAHTHPVAMHGGIDPLDHSIWIPFDAPMMAAADCCIVAMLPSWETSYGIGVEIDAFRKAGKPVLYLDHKMMKIRE